MRRSAALLAVAAALGIPLTMPAPAASASVPRTEVICQDWSIFPQYIRHIFLSADNPTGTRDFNEFPDILTCYEWSGSTPATVSYTISYVANGVDHPDGYTGILTMGHGFSWGTPSPDYVYRASFTLIP
ncbi:hypothetical protein ACOT81_15010 [Streptomyces sp. WI04-05B]|uniref:hypothetical protein n=1 Tax=Streptomyces TaxID=1883 RepID=UPI0029B9E6B4|nr:MULTISPECIES: hypothetical protein [unclassified Streptomyces]MDX2540314.1 hypothetical protein [Streptomyces sp. WI04-05B]MDX2585253.1 hypothetical protein [Streptomyces sp. WI04-05A]MDX3752389.1 hypothetical protein [Streptomyces sp. AK08-02]